MKMQPSKYVVEKDLKETAPSDDPESEYTRNPNVEYDPDYEDINIPNVLFDVIDMINHLDETNGDGKPPYKLRAPQVRTGTQRALIADSFGIPESNENGSHGDSQGDVVLMS